MRFLVGLLAVFLCAAQTPRRDRHVVVISIDGFPAYALEDPKLPIPALRRLAADGVIASAMTTVNPTVTWPNHTALVTGVNGSVHQVLFNGKLTRSTASAPPRVEPLRDKAEMVHAPTVYDIAYRAGLTTAQVDWVAITNPGTISWEFAERPSLQGAVEREMIAAGEASEADIGEFYKSSAVWRDQMWTNAASFITRRHKPNLGLYHLLNLDGTHHTYGPRTPAGFTGIALADTRVQQIVDAVKAAGIYDRTTFIIVSDHGFKAYKKNIRTGVAVQRAGLRGVTVIPEGGTALVYINDAAQRAELGPKLRQTFSGVEGIERIIEPSGYDAIGFPSPTASDQAPDMLLAATSGYNFGGGTEGELIVPVTQGGAHGYVNTDPEMNAIFIAAGPGIRRGAKLDIIRNVDVAPTIAALLGLKMDGVSGQALTAILK